MDVLRKIDTINSSRDVISCEFLSPKTIHNRSYLHYRIGSLVVYCCAYTGRIYQRVITYHDRKRMQIMPSFSLLSIICIVDSKL